MKEGNKLFKRLLSFVAAIAMVLGMGFGSAIPAMAATGDVTVTAKTGQTLTDVTKSNPEVTDKVISITTPNGASMDNASTETFTYEIYKIFDASGSGTGANRTVSYTNSNSNLNLPIYDGANESASNYKFDLDGSNVAFYQKNSNSEWIKDTQATELPATMITKLGTLTGSFVDIGTVTITGAGQTGKVQVAGYGYYYITSTTGSVVAINTLNPSATIGDKNTVPTVTKIENEETNEIGSTVEYTATVHVKKGSENVVFYDTLSNGLTLTGSAPTSVKVGDNDLTAITTSQTTGDYTLTYYNATKGTEGVANGKNIVITFSSSFLSGVGDAGKDVVIKYSATVNSNAVVNENNEAYITYGHDNGYESTPVKVYESTFKFAIKKTDGTNALTGAKFVLSTDSALTGLPEDPESLTDTQKNSLIPLDATSGTKTPSGTNYAVEVKNDGTFTFNGLDGNKSDETATVYYLYEIKAPEGYNKLAHPIAVKITPTFDTNDATKVVSYVVSYNNEGNANGNFTDAGTFTVGSSTAAVSFDIVNTAGSTLPSTGGIGTTIFYVIGGVLVAGAVILLVSRRRRA